MSVQKFASLPGGDIERKKQGAEAPVSRYDRDVNEPQESL
jgi:hypothetical protein